MPRHLCTKLCAAIATLKPPVQHSKTRFANALAKAYVTQLPVATSDREVMGLSANSPQRSSCPCRPQIPAKTNESQRSKHQRTPIPRNLRDRAMESLKTLLGSNKQAPLSAGSQQRLKQRKHSKQQAPGCLQCRHHPMNSIHFGNALSQLARLNGRLVQSLDART